METQKNETLVGTWSKKNKELFDQMAKFEEDYNCTICNQKGCKHMLTEKVKHFSTKSNEALKQLFASKAVIDKLR